MFNYLKCNSGSIFYFLQFGGMHRLAISNFPNQYSKVCTILQSEEYIIGCERKSPASCKIVDQGCLYLK